MNRHHRRSVRLRGYDYSRAGAYFVTVCTGNREFLFGNIHSGKMVVNDAGKMAELCWQKIPEHYPDVAVDIYVVMPNHVHGILVIKNQTDVGANNYSPLRNPPARKQPCGTSRP
ncbi:MAG: transposase, partial [Candidatus Omnitrophica bacterium]|nr:transposase [Candidatus Omnitrophota bacterium]